MGAPSEFTRELEDAQHILERLRENLDDPRVEVIAGGVARAVAIAQFQDPHGREGPHRQADFGPVPGDPVGPMYPSFAAAGQSVAELGAAGEGLCALMTYLEAFQRALVFRADCAEFTDATNNSAVYLRAGGQLDLIEPIVVALAENLATAGTGGRECRPPATPPRA